MRHVISFVCATALLIGGLYLLYAQLFEAQLIHGLALMAAAVMFAPGGAWLWNDFVLPMMRRRNGS